MKKKAIFSAVTILVSVVFFTACKPKPLAISIENPNGSTGDIIDIKLTNGSKAKNPEVSFGNEKALIVASSDSIISVMIPAVLDSTSKKLTVTIDNQKASTDFQINQKSTVRLWFTLKNNVVTFNKKQESNEDFVQNKSYSTNKMMYEITNTKGESIVIGYINHPIQFEVPSEDKKGFSNIEIKNDVQFSINVPAFTDMNKIRFSEITASSKYKAKMINEVSLR